MLNSEENPESGAPKSRLKQGDKSSRLIITLPESKKELWKDFAEQNDMSIAQLVRLGVKEYMHNHASKTQPSGDDDLTDALREELAEVHKTLGQMNERLSDLSEQAESPEKSDLFDDLDVRKAIEDIVGASPRSTFELARILRMDDRDMNNILIDMKRLGRLTLTKTKWGLGQ